MTRSLLNVRNLADLGIEIERRLQVIPPFHLLIACKHEPEDVHRIGYVVLYELVPRLLPHLDLLLLIRLNPRFLNEVIDDAAV